MEAQLLKSKRKKVESQHKDRKNLIVGSFIATFIAITPYLYYLYESVPDEQVWDTYLFLYDAGSWESAKYAMWILTGKIIPLFLFLIWFFTCRHWWYHALLVPIAMYIYQIIGFFNIDLKYIDEFQLMHLVPVMAIIVPSIYLLRARIFNKLNSVNKSMQDLEDEFKIQPKGFWGSIKQYF